MGEVIIGMDPADRWTADEADAIGVVVGTYAVDSSNPFNEYIAVQANGAIGQYNAALVTEDGQAEDIDSNLADDGDNGLAIVGVAQDAFADNEFGWLLVRGTGRVNVGASCAADAVLYTTGTDGRLDDAAAQQINGIKLTTARGNTNGDAPARLRYPYVA